MPAPTLGCGGMLPSSSTENGKDKLFNRRQAILLQWPPRQIIPIDFEFRILVYSEVTNSTTYGRSKEPTEPINWLSRLPQARSTGSDERTDARGTGLLIFGWNGANMDSHFHASGQQEELQLCRLQHCGPCALASTSYHFGHLSDLGITW